jgi:hypothetical protein
MKGILILSSEKRDIDLLRHAARGVGFEGNIEVIKSPSKLLDRLQELESTPPAAVFVDVSAVPDGVRVVEWLKLSSRTRRLRIIAIGHECDAIRHFTNAWGSQAVLMKPLHVAAAQQLMTNLDLAVPGDATVARSQQIKKLVQAIQTSRELREKQDRLLRHVDVLMAELKDKKAPFKRKQISEHSKTIREDNRAA